ncbi:hypothetical protein FN846DRAFT_41217 [Sphaerosporella brunnea]|uniref:Uncharacterized protein n=1 Tax=Sphaerosporella brunnea TaxID=1250544 RepID=A0A5J5FA67_9PEZI|nr:hypothetical protein FN846DRAFT_41217 [Sphaerosporella brunnea]
MKVQELLNREKEKKESELKQKEFLKKERERELKEMKIQELLNREKEKKENELKQKAKENRRGKSKKETVAGKTGAPQPVAGIANPPTTGGRGHAVPGISEHPEESGAIESNIGTTLFVGPTEDKQAALNEPAQGQSTTEQQPPKRLVPKQPVSKQPAPREPAAKVSATTTAEVLSMPQSSTFNDLQDGAFPMPSAANHPLKASASSLGNAQSTVPDPSQSDAHPPPNIDGLNHINWVNRFDNQQGESINFEDAPAFPIPRIAVKFKGMNSGPTALESASTMQTSPRKRPKRSKPADVASNAAGTTASAHALAEATAPPVRKKSHKKVAVPVPTGSTATSTEPQVPAGDAVAPSLKRPAPDPEDLPQPNKRSPVAPPAAPAPKKRAYTKKVTAAPDEGAGASISPDIPFGVAAQTTAPKKRGYNKKIPAASAEATGETSGSAQPLVPSGDAVAPAPKKRTYTKKTPAASAEATSQASGSDAAPKKRVYRKKAAIAPAEATGEAQPSVPPGDAAAAPAPKKRTYTKKTPAASAEATGQASGSDAAPKKRVYRKKTPAASAEATSQASGSDAAPKKRVYRKKAAIAPAEATGEAQPSVPPGDAAAAPAPKKRTYTKKTPAAPAGASGSDAAPKKRAYNKKATPVVAAPIAGANSPAEP